MAQLPPALSNPQNAGKANVLYPAATLAPQRISEILTEIGLEENRRLFYHKYMAIPCCLFALNVLVDCSG